MKKKPFLLLLALLGPLALTYGQTAAGFITVTVPDATNNPMCTATLTTDCIQSVDIFAKDRTTKIDTVPASAFTVVNNVNTASWPIPTVPGRRYGTFELYARTNGVAADGTIVPSLDGAAAVMLRRPPPASLALN